MLMMKVVANVANASEKRTKLNSIHEEDNNNVFAQFAKSEFPKKPAYENSRLRILGFYQLFELRNSNPSPLGPAT
ncbi:hypothetical protein JHK82_039991 [Glycine max]|nr:hypothetical protein JHK82_039991 [Glycine max]KAG5122064.1 hypothetical protein JHK84_040404 [Glycine max]